MFVVDRHIKFIDPSDKKLLTILKSSNQPFIAAADRPAEPTESFICSFQNKNKKIETYIMLHLVKSEIRVFYRSEKGEFLPDEFDEVEGDALEFVESMGFTMDNITFQKMNEIQRNELFETLPIFIDKEKHTEIRKDVEEPEYISSAELAEELEEVLSEDDLKEIESQEKSEEVADLLDGFASELEVEHVATEDTKADPIAPVDASMENIAKPLSKQVQKVSESLSKIARIMSSF